MAQLKVKFVEFAPNVPSYNYMFMLEAMTYKAKLEIADNTSIKPSDVKVQVWTNCYDLSCATGSWHSVDLNLLKDQNNEQFFTYGKSIVITNASDFSFTFRMKYDGVEDWIWSHNYGENGFAHVEPPRDGDKWTLGVDYNHICDSVHLGNFIAATNAAECGFTHVLNVADNLDMVYQSKSVNYLKVPLKDGAGNPISDKDLHKAISWLIKHNSEGNTLLVNCRAGIGRAGSVVVGYVYATTPGFTYDQAYQFVFSKRFVYPHAGLEESLKRIFPRKKGVTESVNTF